MANQLMQFFEDIPDETSKEIVRQKTERISKIIEDNTIKTFDYKAKNYTVLNKKAKPGGTVFAGDSIAELFPVHEFFSEWQEKTKSPLYNRGISGELSGNLLARLDANVLSINPRNLVLIIGTNDLAQGISPETITGNIEQIIEKARAASPDVTIILCSIFPVNENMADIPSRLMVGIRKNSAIRALNVFLKAMTESTGGIFLDVTPHLISDDGQLSLEYTFDGLHPNAVGYEILAAHIIPLLR